MSQKDLRVLHIVSWFPNKENSKEAIWIKRHITSLEDLVESQFVLHIQVKPSDKFKFKQTRSEGLSQRILQVPFKSWFLIEILTAVFLCYYLVRFKVQKRFDVVNFHIAYPLLTYWYLIKRFITVPTVVSEHWSAYHFNFKVKNTEKLKKIKRIFQQDIPVIAVSEALKRDIQKFSGSSLLPVKIVPNIVSEEFLFDPSFQKTSDKTLFMLSGWKWPKRPDITIKAFASFLKETEENYFLRIGGFGTLLSEMKKLVAELGIADKVKFLGSLDSAAIAEEMKGAIALLHCSEYETFSVVCAEALSVGCPVVASKVGGIMEFVDAESGILVEDNEVNTWKTALVRLQGYNFLPQQIASKAIAKFSPDNVGKRYYRILSKIVGNAKR